MHKITIRVYENGCNTFSEFTIPQFAIVTGKEDHFRHAYAAACFIVEGIRWARSEAIVEIVKIELRS